jgi:tetratricopeptide (TPR) repeat protein
MAFAWPWMKPRLYRSNPVLVLVDPEVEEGAGIGRAHRLVLGNLVQDFIEGAARVPLYRIPAAVGPENLADQAEGQTLVVRLRAVRREARLQWILRWTRVQDMKAGLGMREAQSPLLPPREALSWLLAELPLQFDSDALPGLLPNSPEAFWEFVDASALGSEGKRQDEAIRRLGELALRFPGSALVRAQLGIQLYFRINGSSETVAEDQVRAQSELLEATRLAPFLPRAVAFLSRLRTDTGSVRDALELLQKARKQRPENPSILAALSYPCRYAGLLEVATLAADEAMVRNPLRTRPLRLAFHLLYVGRWDEFQTSLWEWPGDLRNATCRFHRGHLALIRGDRERALSLMREAEQMEESYGQNLALAHIYRLILEGHSDQARILLKDVQRSRSGMRVADGEITMSLAGAYALLDDPAQAMELMRGAFSQGFGCTRWYETHPSLAAARKLPQWPSLQQNLKERQALFESRFPKSAFGL